jgi:hypothetical protein
LRDSAGSAGGFSGGAGDLCRPPAAALPTAAYDDEMPASRRNSTIPNDPLAIRKRKPVPHQFVLDAIAPLAPVTRSMFGCLAVYVGNKIVFFLRDKPGSSADNGVWLATTEQHHASLRREFPHMRSIRLLGKKVTHWQVLPADTPDFEEAAMRAADLVLARDPRIGKIPNSQRARTKGAAPSSSEKKSRKAAMKRRTT